MVWTDRNLTLWNPWMEVRRFQADRNGMESVQGAPTNVFTSDDAILVRVLLPGFSADQIDVSVEGRTLTLHGDSTGSEEAAQPFARVFERTFRLPHRVDVTSVAAELVDGVLELRLPLAEADKKQKITIESSS